MSAALTTRPEALASFSHLPLRETTPAKYFEALLSVSTFSQRLGKSRALVQPLRGGCRASGQDV